MYRGILNTISIATLAGLAITPIAQAPKVENGLMGIKLYDSGVAVTKKFGSPTDIEEIRFGQAGATGGGRPGGGGFAGGGGGGGGAGPGAAQPMVDFIAPPMGSYQAGVPQAAGAAGPGGGAPGAGPAGAGGARQGGAAGSQEDLQFVRWIYRRGTGSSVNFVLNKFNKVVQIEVIGISNPSARTSQGLTLGGNLATVIQRYGDPDGYDIGGDYFMVRFLTKSKVAFRFTRENPRSPYRITGIVVSAGKV